MSESKTLKRSSTEQLLRRMICAMGDTGLRISVPKVVGWCITILCTGAGLGITLIGGYFSNQVEQAHVNERQDQRIEMIEKQLDKIDNRLESMQSTIIEEIRRGNDG